MRAPQCARACDGPRRHRSRAPRPEPTRCIPHDDHPLRATPTRRGESAGGGAGDRGRVTSLHGVARLQQRRRRGHAAPPDIGMRKVEALYRPRDVQDGSNERWRPGTHLYAVLEVKCRRGSGTGRTGGFPGRDAHGRGSIRELTPQPKRQTLAVALQSPRTPARRPGPPPSRFVETLGQRALGHRPGTGAHGDDKFRTINTPERLDESRGRPKQARHSCHNPATSASCGGASFSAAGPLASLLSRPTRVLGKLVP